MNTVSVLVPGGAGYIGAHMCKHLAADFAASLTPAMQVRLLQIAP